VSSRQAVPTVELMGMSYRQKNGIRQVATILSLTPTAEGDEESLRFYLHVIAQHQLLGVGMQIHLLVHPLGHRISVQAILKCKAI
jgi:hypothetical protein